ncbi:phosphotriesterase [Chloroflexota bacterium]
MCRSKLAGKAQMVLGSVSAKDLGIVLPHEHLLSDLSMRFRMRELATANEKALAHQPVSLENRYWVVFHQEGNLDNLQLLDEKLAINEALNYKQAGGNTIVDLSNIGSGRDPLGLKHIALATGLNIIMGSGYYVSATHSADIDRKTEDEIAEEIVRDITLGVGDTGERAGIIGEIGCSWPLVDNERKVLRAASLAQQLTGAPLNIHPGPHSSAPFEIIEILRNSGADISRTVISHIDRTIRNPEDCCKLMESGCYLEYDMFGWEGYFPRDVAMVDLPNDTQRINELIELIAQGYVNQILISQDICCKVRLRCYGGHGYSHILDNVVPLMRDKGISKEHISSILVENPKHLLQFV